MSVRDILLASEQTPVPTAAPTPAPTLAPTTPTLYDTMPINMKTGTDDSTWQSICYDGVDTFAAIRNFARSVSFSKSPIAGESWFNANTSGEMLDADIKTSICGNAGTFIVTMVQSLASNSVGRTVIQRLKYDPNTDLYNRTSPVKLVSTGSAPSGVLSTVPYGYGQAYCSAYGNGVFVVGGYFWIAYSKDDGVTWTFIPTAYAVYSIVYGEAKTTSGGKVPRFVFSTTMAAPNETVGYCVFDANKDLTVITTQVTGTQYGKVAYADGIFMINTSTSNRRDFVYTEDLKSFEQAPQLPNPTNNNYSIIDTTYFSVTNNGGGKIVGADKHFLVFPTTSSFYVEPESEKANTNFMNATTLSTSTGVLSAAGTGTQTPAQRATNKFDNQYVYRLSTTRTSAGWTAAWESIPLTYSSEEPVDGWPVVAPETSASVYGRSAVGPYRAACYGKGVVLAPRWLGDKLTIVDPTIA